jgi:superfamily I DNA/RNA helicase
MTANEILNQLNPEQGEAVKAIKGPVLVLAGAGTGKTRVITFRIAYMLECGIDPHNILGLTFTNKAAREMKERLAQLVPPQIARKVTLGTFHSVCIRILRREIEKLNYMRNFTIADETDQGGLIKQAIAQLGYPKGTIPVSHVSAFISSQKNRLLTPKDTKLNAETEYQIRMAQVYEVYQELLEMQNMLDFDDMLLLVYELFEKRPDVLKKYQNKYQYLLVDEYQDTNDAQFTVIKMLVGENQNICVVGDDDQSIYGWRGANVGNILDFPRIFKGTKEVKLEQNYRSTNKILTAANTVIAENADRYEKNLWSAMGDGENLILVNAPTAEGEADFISAFIVQEIEEKPNLSYNDFAILYRSNHLSRALEHSLRQHQIPYRLVGGQEFFKRKEIKDAVAYLKLIVNPKEDQSLLRIISIPPRGIGKKVIDQMKEQKARDYSSFTEMLGNKDFISNIKGKATTALRELNGTLHKYRKLFEEPGGLTQKVTEFLDEVGYLSGLQKVYKDIEDAMKRRENVDEFINAIAQFESKAEEPPTLADYLESYALLEENDKVDEQTESGPGVTLTTVHASKGLEYPYVFLVALEKNIFPHERSLQEGSLDEELRLFYVALTRAKERLIISYTTSRMYRGFDRNQLPSPFLPLMPENIVDSHKPDELIKTMDSEHLDKAFADIFAILND